MDDKKLKPLTFRINIEWEDDVDDDIRDSIRNELGEMLNTISAKYQKIIKLIKKISIIKD